MITKGIITKTPSFKSLEGRNTNKYEVRLPLFESAGINSPYLVDACLCYNLKSNINIKENDIVYVAFENNEVDKPLILGKLYCDKNLLNETNNDYNEINNLIVKLEKDLDWLNKKVDEINSINTTSLLPEIKITSTSSNIFTYEENIEQEEIEEEPKYYTKVFVKIKKEDLIKLSPTDEFTLSAFRKVKRSKKLGYRKRLSVLNSISVQELIDSKLITTDSKGDNIIELRFNIDLFKHSYGIGVVQVPTRFIRIRRKIFNSNNNTIDAYFSNKETLYVRQTKSLILNLI